MLAIILAVANLYYVFLYTIYLKPRTPQNIVIGGAAGAFPPMIGWAMATGEFSWVSFALFLFVFTWTPPHSWALALYKRDDYAAAGFPMLPVVAGEAETKPHHPLQCCDGGRVLGSLVRARGNQLGLRACCRCLRYYLYCWRYSRGTLCRRRL